MAKKKKDYEAHEAAIQSLLEHASRKGWQIVEEREIDFGYRVVVYDGFTRNNVDFYPSGKILVQGKQGALWDELGRWKEERNTAAAQKTGKVSLPFEDMPPVEQPVPVEQAITAPGSKPTARESIVLGQSADPQMDSAVAAASIVAEAEYVRYMDQVAQRVGQQLPRGDSDELVISVGREIVAKGGKEALGEVAKLHFGLTRKIFQYEGKYL